MIDCNSIMWKLNAPLTRSGVQKQISDFAKQGFTSVLPVPIANATVRAYGQDFTNSGMQCDYLSESFFNQYDYIVDACRDNNLHIWIWDDDFCPSGWAGGAIVKSYPHLRGKTLHRIEKNQPLPENTLKVLLETVDCKYVYASGPASSMRTDVFHPETVKQFIALNYEPYHLRYGKDFGHLITGIFFDEPGIAGCLGGLFRIGSTQATSPLPWTEDALDVWTQNDSSSLLNLLPMLFAIENQSDEANLIRAQFGAMMHNLWIERWMKPARQWCHEHDLIFSGHMNNDDYVEAHLNTGGNLLNTLNHFDLPGVDVVVSQILPEKEKQSSADRSEWDLNSFNSDFIRFAPSAARNQPMGRAFCELGDAYGWGCNLALCKWLLDYHLARGIDFIFWGATQYSVSNADIMSTGGYMGPEQPYWFLWHKLNRYGRNIIDMLCKSERCAKVAIMYPAEGYMQCVGSHLNEKFDALACFLRSNGVDYDYIEMNSDSGRHYDQIFVPGQTPIGHNELEWLAMKAKKCQVITPKQIAIENADHYCYTDVDFSNSSLLDSSRQAYRGLHLFLRPEIHLSQSEEMSFHVRQIVPNQFIYFLFNENSQKPIDIDLNCPEKMTLFKYQYDDDIFERHRETVITLRPDESAFILIGLEDTILTHFNKVIRNDTGQHPKQIIMDPKKGAFLKATKYGWDGCGFVENKLTSEEYLSLNQEFSGSVTYHHELYLNDSYEAGVELKIANTHSAVSVVVNGQKIGDVLWSPRTISIDDQHLRHGKNILELTLHNTLANHIRSNAFSSQLSSKGICENNYFKMTKGFDRNRVNAETMLNNIINTTTEN